MTYAFDTLKFTQRLEHVGVGRDQAVAHAELARDMILADVATKIDLDALQTALKADNSVLRPDVESSIRELELRMAIKLGAMIAASVAIIAAIQKLF